MLQWIFGGMAGLALVWGMAAGAGGQTVRKIQRRLAELGYPVGYVDGSYGDQTQIAVSLFYEAIRQRERSYITPQMYQKLFSGSAPYYDAYLPLQRGDQGLRVRMLQTALPGRCS